MKLKEDMIIIGGGLSGLTLAYLLSKKNIKATVVEASPRLGGRIQTRKGALETPLEMGATWFSDMHSHLLQLIRELQLNKYPQFSKGISVFQTKSFEPPQKFFVPEAEQPSYRLAGGTQVLINALAQQLQGDSIRLQTKITAIKETADDILLETADGSVLHADKVVLCIPPQLAAAQINFSPALPEALTAILPAVQTWMAGAIKFTLEYATPFWRNEGYSGMLYSHAGIVTEMYDHTNFEENKFGFTGFLNGGAAAYAPEIRKELVLDQLAALFGEDILAPVAYFDKVWTGEFILAGSQAGTETAVAFPGYMEGAVIAAETVATKLIGGFFIA